MKHWLYRKISDFGMWLWMKFRVITATEVMMMERFRKPRICEHCGKSVIRFIDEK